MKRAKYMIFDAAISCAYCGECFTSAPGDICWDEKQIVKHGPYLHCNTCGRQSQIIGVSEADEARRKIERKRK